MATYNFDVTSFRTQFTAFADDARYPDITLQSYWDTGGNFVANQSGWCLTDAQHVLSLNLMTAHLAQLSTLIAAGQTPGIITAATIDKVSVTLKPPPGEDQWSYWLNLTPYGQQLMAMFEVAGAGGFYINGSPEIAAFRRPGRC